MLNEFMKLGQVVEVRGQKIRARVFENKNGPILLYKGNIIKNVSVGSFIKIPKGFISIIGKIEGEHISELREKNAAQRFQKESDSIERMIDISVLGVMEHGIFQKGMVEIPLVFSDVYILEEYELQRVFSFFENRANAVALGNIAEYKNYKLYVDAQLLFASHIGIFGNTGSGKSNTLATLYTVLFQKYGTKKNFEKSRFLIFDYNGEYNQVFSKNGQVYHLSTYDNAGDRIPVPYCLLDDVDFWAVLCEASEKTQRPFLERVVEMYRHIRYASCTGQKHLAQILQKLMKELFLGCYRQDKLTEENREDLFDLFAIVLKDTKELEPLHSKMRLQGELSHLYTKEKTYETRENNFSCDIVEPMITLLTQENIREIDGYDMFAFALQYRKLYDTLRRDALSSYIDPVVKRFEIRLLYIRRLFAPVEREPEHSNIEIISLENVNAEFKKLITVLLSRWYYRKRKRERIGSLHLILDEAHHILRGEPEAEELLWKDYGKETFEELIKEGRKFGAFLTICSQRPSDIPDSIVSQMQNYFIHRMVNKEDIHAVERAVVFLEEDSFSMVSVLPKGTCIFAGVASNFPVMVEMDRLNENVMAASDTIDLIRFWNGEKDEFFS